MADDPNRIDPRYDPAFQRGFHGDVRTQQRTESTLRRTALVSPASERPEFSASERPAPVDLTAAPRVVEESPVVPTAAEPVGAEAPSAPPATDPVVIAGEPAPSARDVTRNPFYLAAAALAVLLIIGGAVWLDRGFAAIADGRAASDVGYYAASTMSVGAPMLMGIGILIIAGLLFVLARGWRPRDGDRDDDRR